MRSIIMSAAIFAVLPAFAAEPSTDPAPEPAPPAIEVVREGDGGVADAWRGEGAGFAAFGPDGEAVVPTVERQALQALTNAYDVQLVALAAGGRCAADCVGGRAVATRVAGDTIAKYALARDVGDEWLATAEPGPSDGAVAWTHALTFSSDGHAWEALASYDAGRYLLRRDGADVGAGAIGGATQRAAFDALLEQGTP